MKNLFTFSIAALFSFYSFSQNTQTTTESSILLFDSIKIQVGDTLHFGRATGINGDFAHIWVVSVSGASAKTSPLSGQWRNRNSIIKYITVTKSLATGTRYIAVIGGEHQWEADLEVGVKSQEVLGIDRRRFHVQVVTF